MNFKRKKLTANVEEIIAVNSQNVTVLNIGPDPVYINFNSTATIDSLLIPSGMGRSFHLPYVVKNVHAIASTAVEIQVDGLM